MAKQYADDAFLLELYPEAVDVPPDRRVRWLAYARGIVHLENHGEKSDDAHASMTMHLLALQSSAPASLKKNKIGSMSLGPGSISWATMAVTESGLELTNYGIHYKLLEATQLGVVY